jgi:hypothetical protein
LVREHVTVLAQDSPELGICPVECGYVDEHVPAPHEVNGGIVDGEGFGSPQRLAHTISYVGAALGCRRQRFLGDLHMALDRVGPGNGEPEVPI